MSIELQCTIMSKFDELYKKKIQKKQEPNINYNNLKNFNNLIFSTHAILTSKTHR